MIDCRHNDTYYEEDSNGLMYMACVDCHKVLDDEDQEDDE